MKQLLATLTSAALFGFMCLVPAVHAIEPGAIGYVGGVHGNLVQGQVFASKPGDQRQLTKGASIYEGDTIETIGEGAVVLLFQDGTMWDVFDDSILVIKEYKFSDGGEGDKAIFEVHQGEVTYTSGTLGERGAEVAIKTGNTTVYPQGTVISFSFKQNVAVIRVVQGQGRVESRGTQTTETVVGPNQYLVAAESLQSPQNRSGVVVTSSAKVVVATVAQALVNSLQPFSPLPVKPADKEIVAAAVATNIVTKINAAAKPTVSIRPTGTTEPEAEIETEVTTTTPGAGGAGGGGTIIVASPS